MTSRNYKYDKVEIIQFFLELNDLWVGLVFGVGGVGGVRAVRLVGRVGELKDSEE